MILAKMRLTRKLKVKMMVRLRNVYIGWLFLCFWCFFCCWYCFLPKKIFQLALLKMQGCTYEKIIYIRLRRTIQIVKAKFQVVFYMSTLVLLGSNSFSFLIIIIIIIIFYYQKQLFYHLYYYQIPVSFLQCSFLQNLDMKFSCLFFLFLFIKHFFVIWCLAI